MAEQLSLLDYVPPKYPHHPGHKARATARDAARAIGGRAPTLRQLALDVIRTAEGATADEVAEILGRSILSIRPRVSELAALGLIYETTVRRPNASSVMAIVWKVSAAGMALPTA